jgi:hypothetical protein
MACGIYPIHQKLVGYGANSDAICMAIFGRIVDTSDFKIVDQELFFTSIFDGSKTFVT